MIVCVCVDKREQVDKSCLLEKACVIVQTQARSFVLFEWTGSSSVRYSYSSSLPYWGLSLLSSSAIINLKRDRLSKRDRRPRPRRQWPHKSAFLRKLLSRLAMLELSMLPKYLRYVDW